MARQFFVNPKNVTRLYPWGEDGDNKQYWIDVKDRLSAKEEKDVQTAGIPHMLQKTEKGEAVKTGEVKMGLDVGRMSLVRATRYILAWSLTDDAGSPMPVSEAAIGELTPDAFDAIDKALDAHKAAKEAALADPPKAGTPGLKSA